MSTYRASLLALFLVGCGSTAAPPARTPAPEPVESRVDRPPEPEPEALCRLEGDRIASLTGTRTGVRFVGPTGGTVEARLVAHGDGVVLLATVTDDGWRLEGAVDPTETPTVNVTRPIWLTSWLAVHPSSSVRVLGASADAVRVQAVLPDRVEAEVEPLELPCGELTLRNDFEGDLAEALELPEAHGGRLLLAAGTEAELRVEPDGPVVARITPGDRAIGVNVLEEREAQTRIRLGWRSFVVGWIDSEALVEPSADGRNLAYGALMTSPDLMESMEVCALPSTATLELVSGDSREPIGRLEAGAELVPVARRPGEIDVRRYADASPPEGVRWTVRTDASPTCWVRPPSMSPVGLGGSVTGSRAGRSSRFRGTATVRSSDLARVGPGDACRVEVQHVERLRPACRLTVQCGRRTVYEGALDCTLAPDGTLLSMSDTATSASSQTPMAAYRARTSSLVLADDDSGRLRAFRMTLEVSDLQR